MHSLPIFLRLKARPVILLGEGAVRDAKARLLQRAGAIIVGEGDAAALAIVAIEDEDLAVAAVARLKARGILVNAVDRPALCDFTLPAIVDRDPVLVAIGTGGASAGLAKVLRQRIEALLPASLGKLATGLHSARGAIRARWTQPDQRRRAIDAALEGPLDPLRAQDGDAVARWLAAPDIRFDAGLVTMVLRSDDPDDLSLREARLLGQADTIFHAPDVSAAILARIRADAARVIAAPSEPLPAGLSIFLTRRDEA
ncbi:precorrin-2 dehydrogenase/sirohydrochlorin ferrochelatase family protein [Sphingomonas cavernae]|uniref:precorrin-2 dehydrogenase n=1 Tax=Sphingomonas cavernae TaxID=2320861 RepID=A0A418WRV0_9SPHN|nr:bifunctional precorrin-2 dehydrogenase/sirohydrochlorin ferrochelatase [Sphingomonas cavernae]RJF93983.1 siroheme synthase [Sphingomonas cavernae]